MAAEGGLSVRPVAVDLVGLGLELGGHQAQALGAGEIEAAPRDAEAVFSLATQELGSEHDQGNAWLWVSVVQMHSFAVRSRMASQRPQIRAYR
jgi:hypothetical protein